MADYHIALDLELEQPNDGQRVTDSNVEYPEIIQVGWTIFKVLPFDVVKTEEEEVYKDYPLSSFIKTLTGITDEEISEGLSLGVIFNLLNEDRECYNTSRIVKQWGGGDMTEFREALGYPDDWPFGKSGKNVKHLYQDYAIANGIQKSGGLSKCMGKLGLSWQGRGKHRAGVDSLNTAYIYSCLLDKFKDK